MVSFRDPGGSDADRGAAQAGEKSGEKIAPVTYLRGAGHTPDSAPRKSRSGADAWFGSEPETESETASGPTSRRTTEPEPEFTTEASSATAPARGSGTSPRKRSGAGSAAGHLRAVSAPGADDENEPDEPIADPEQIESLLVRKLARRSLSEAEVLAFAVQEGLTAAQANTILDRLRDLGYVDDRALAEQLKHSLSERKGQSKAVVARAMSGRSIDRDIINEVLDDIEQEDELGVATELAKKRASQMSGLDKQTLERRLTGFLARRGYPGHIVREAIAPVLTGRASAPSSTVRFR